jgi:hypothetical protein
MCARDFDLLATRKPDRTLPRARTLEVWDAKATSLRCVEVRIARPTKAREKRFRHRALRGNLWAIQ